MDLNDKKSFLLYTEYAETFNELSDEDAGKLIKAIFNYVQYGKLDELKGILKIAFIPIKQNIDRDIEKWKQIRTKRSEAGKIGGMNKAINSKQKSEKENTEKDEKSLANAKKTLQNKKNSSKSKQSVANLAVNVNDNVNVNVNVNDNVNVNVDNIDKTIDTTNIIDTTKISNDNIYIPNPEEKVLTAKANKHKYR